MSESYPRNDWVHQRIAWVVWGIPIGLFVIGAFLGPLARTLVWAPALLVAGGACVVNAHRCHRVHCYLTGPVFLIAALITVLRGFDVVALLWTAIGAAVVAGTVLAHIPEWVGGKYRAAQCIPNERR